MHVQLDCWQTACRRVCEPEVKADNTREHYFLDATATSITGRLVDRVLGTLGLTSCMQTLSDMADRLT